MLQSIRVSNFKILAKEAVFRLQPMTVLTGLNGRGKSSLIQPLLMLRNAVTLAPGRVQLPLNCVDYELGTAVEVRNRDTSRTEPVRFTLDRGVGDDFAVGAFTFDASEDGAVSLEGAFELEECSRAGRTWMAGDAAPPPVDSDWIVSGESIRYVSAARLGPQATVKMTVSRSADVGADGLGAFSVLAEANSSGRTIEESRRAPEAGGAAALPSEQVAAWMDWIFEGAGFALTTSASALVHLPVLAAGSRHLVRPTNTGFGLSAVLPVVVQALLAEKDQTVIVENPEIHLHPAAQSRLGRFLGAMARCGTQLIVETHSEHVLAGVRREVAGGGLLASHVALYFFGRDATPARLEVASDGTIGRWPEGFFDQATRDMVDIYG